MTKVQTSRRRPVALLAVVLTMGTAASVRAGGNAIQMKNGYFWDPVATNYWVPHGFAYQTINPPVYATQTPDQIDYDFLEMKKMHADSLRVDFTWGYIEPANGVFDFTATDQIIATAEKYGLRLFALIGYQYPPGWFSNAWMAVNISNQTANLLNYEHPLARAAYSDFISHVTARYKDSPAIAGWILGNEYAYFDLWEPNDPHLYVGYDTNYCLPSFQNYLTNLYAGSIGALNANWGTAYAGFGNVTMPTNYPGSLATNDFNNQQNRYYPAYYDMLQWRKKSIGDFVAVGAVAAKNSDTNHLCSYSMVGGIFSGFDSDYTCEDAKTIVARCAAAGAPLDFWSINNYAWASEGNELRSAQFGITKYQAQSGLPVLITETGHSSTENLFPGADVRQPAALPGQVWEAVMAGAIGVHIFTWNDRPFNSRETGFGIVQTNRVIKNPVYWNILETFRRMEQLNVSSLMGGSQNPAPDIYFYWSKDADMVWPRANQENCMLWGGLKRLGYEPGFLDEDGYDAQAYTNVKALLLSHAFMMASNRIAALTNVIAKGVNVHSSGVLPGRYDPYHKDNPSWVGVISNVFGLTVGSATNYWHGGVAGNWDQPYTGIGLTYLTTLGPLTTAYPWTNVATWIRMDGITANSGTTIVNLAYDYYGTRSMPGLQINGHGSQGKAAINTWTLGDTLNMWWLTPQDTEMALQLHYDWCRAIYRTWFGMTPAIDLSGAGYFYVIPDYRTCTNGSVLISLLNESTNATTFTLSATGLITGATVEQLSPAAGILTTNSNGQLNFTLAGDEYVLLYAYTNGQSLVGTGPARVWMASEPPGGIWPNGQPRPVSVGYDTRGATLDLYLALERTDGAVTEFARTNVIGVAGVGTNTLNLSVIDADLYNAQYVSTHDGATYQLHAWLQNGSTTQGECRLTTRLLWGARPTSLPSYIVTGHTYQVTVNWQELPSYLSSELPTPLSRADVWQPSLSNAESYTVYLDLMTGNVAVVSSNFVTSTGTASNQFSVTVPAGMPANAKWRARLLSGALTGPTSNNNDVVDGFEDRGNGNKSSGNLIAPWTGYAYAANSANLDDYGVGPTATSGTNGAFLVASIGSPNAYAGFGMTRQYATEWALPPSNQWSNIVFSFRFKETNNYACTMQMKLEDTSDPSANISLHYEKTYGPAGWDSVAARLSDFTHDAGFDTNHITKLTVNIIAGTLGVQYVGWFDDISFTGTPWIVSAPSSDNDDVKMSFEDLPQGAHVNPTPWSLDSYNSGTENNYLNHGVDTFASDGSQGFFAVYTSHTNVTGYSGFYLNYVFPNAPILPSDLSKARFSADFYETNGRACTLQLQLKSADGGLSMYTTNYVHTPGSWFTIGANLNAFTGTANMNNLSEMNVLCEMLTPGGLVYVAHFDNISFTGTLTSVGNTNALYLSINDTPSGVDSDGDGIPDAYESNTGIYNGPTDTGTDPANPDSDGDGLSDGDEVIAGTDPNSVGSVFQMDTMAGSNASGMVIEWFARTNKIYTVYHLDGSLVSGTFTPLGSFTNITVSTNGYTNVVDAMSTSSRFYRVDVRLP